MLATIIILCVFAVILLVVVIYFSSTFGLSKYSEGTATVMMGAKSELMSQDQRKAAEVIVEQKADKNLEEQTSGELIE